MDENLLHAKMAIMIARESSTNHEKVLAEIIRMSKQKKGITVKEMVKEIPDRLTMKESFFRKTLSELFKDKLLLKVGVTVYVNPELIKI